MAASHWAFQSYQESLERPGQWFGQGRLWWDPLRLTTWRPLSAGPQGLQCAEVGLAAVHVLDDYSQL